MDKSTEIKNTILTALLVAIIFLFHPSLNKGDGFISNFQDIVYGKKKYLHTSKSIFKKQKESSILKKDKFFKTELE